MADANVSVSFSASVGDFVSQVSEAKNALQTFSAPFGEINRQLVSFGTTASQAFSADHLTPYRNALSATQSLQQSFAADSARAAAALRAGDDAAYADAARAAQLATSEELRILADATKQKLALYAEEARSFQITQQQKLSLSQQVLDAEYSAEVAAIQREEALGNQSLAAKQRVDDMIIEAARRRDDQMSALTRSALQGQEREYQAFGNSIMQAFNSQLRGLVTGTTTWHRAFKSVLDDLLVKFIEWCDTTVEHYVLAEAMKTAATTSGVAARTSRGRERRRGLAGRTGRGDGAVDPLLGRGNIRRGVRVSGAAHGPAGDRPRHGGPGHGRGHGGRRCVSRYRHVAGAAGHADPYSSQRAYHAGGGSRRLSLDAGKLGERRRLGRPIGGHSSNHALQCLGDRWTLGCFLDAFEWSRHGQGPRRGGAPWRGAGPEETARIGGADDDD